MIMDHGHFQPVYQGPAEATIMFLLLMLEGGRERRTMIVVDKGVFHVSEHSLLFLLKSACLIPFNEKVTDAAPLLVTNRRNILMYLFGPL